MKESWISVFVFVLLIVLFVAACTASAGSEDDSAWHLFWVVFLLLAFLKGPGK